MRVLVAEDEPVTRRLLQGHLESWGHEVTTAPEGAAAWRLFQSGTFPLVLSDWMMPEMDGLELVQHIRANPQPTYVYIILLTARAEKSDVVKGMESGADDFVTKPFDRDELRVRVRAGERILHLEHTLADQNQALRAAQAALVQNEKLASLGRLAAGVAHEINNPLAYVINNVAVLRRDMSAAMNVLNTYRRGHAAFASVEPKLAAEAAQLEQEMDLAFFQAHLGRMCDKSLDGLQRVRDIVRNLRDFARLDEAEFKEADLNIAVTSALEILDHEFRHNALNLVTDMHTLPPVYCHLGKVNQVVVNLLVNAIEACAPGGTVTLRTRALESGVVIEVEDNGCGIAPEHLPRIFEPFFTTKPVGHGTGLGLAVSFGIVRDHGGSLEVDSTLGRGTLFRASLPLRPPVRDSAGR